MDLFISLSSLFAVPLCSLVWIISTCWQVHNVQIIFPFPVKVKLSPNDFCCVFPCCIWKISPHTSSFSWRCLSVPLFFVYLNTASFFSLALLYWRRFLDLTNHLYVSIRLPCSHPILTPCLTVKTQL